MTAAASAQPRAIRPTIPGRFVAEMVGRSAAAARTLETVGIGVDALRVPRFRVSTPQFAALYRATCMTEDDEFFGYLRRPVPRGAYLTLLRLLTTCRDAAACLDATRRFYRLFDRHDYWRAEHDAEGTRLRVALRNAKQRRSALFCIAMLLTPCRTLGWLTDHAVRVDGLRLDPQFTDFAAECRYVFGTDPQFEPGACELRLLSPRASVAVLRRPHDVDAYAGLALEGMLAPAAPDTLVDQIRALLGSAQPLGSARLEDVAAALAVSKQTLSRRLADLGLNFQGLKDDLRRDHAIALLTKTTQTIAEIGLEVGYSEPSAFVRAFRSWLGVAPGRYRADPP